MTLTPLPSTARLADAMAAEFPDLAPLISGHSDIAIGSRLARGLLTGAVPIAELRRQLGRKPLTAKGNRALVGV